MLTPFIVTFFLLAGAHAVCDYPLQGEFLARGKNHRAPLPGFDWRWLLAMHALIHGFAVAVITRSVLLGLLETGAHLVIDYAKCDGRIDFNTDQTLHLGCKAVWTGVVLA